MTRPDPSPRKTARALTARALTTRALTARALSALACIVLAASAAPALEADCFIRPSETVRIGAPVNGIIAEIGPERGDWVEAGSVLARLDTTLQEMTIRAARARAEDRAEISAAEARLAFVTAQLERYRTLAERNVVSSAQVQETETELLVAENDLRAAERNIALARADLDIAEAERDRRTIRAPVAGYVVERSLSAGEFWTEQQALMTLAAIDPLHVEAAVDIAAFPGLRPGQRATILPEPPFDRPRTARVEVIDRVFDAASGTFGLRLVLDNPDRALPAGLRCTLRLEREG